MDYLTFYLGLLVTCPRSFSVVDVLAYVMHYLCFITLSKLSMYVIK